MLPDRRLRAKRIARTKILRHAIRHRGLRLLHNRAEEQAAYDQLGRTVGFTLENRATRCLPGLSQQQTTTSIEDNVETTEKMLWDPDDSISPAARRILADPPVSGADDESVFFPPLYPKQERAAQPKTTTVTNTTRYLPGIARSVVRRANLRHVPCLCAPWIRRVWRAILRRANRLRAQRNLRARAEEQTLYDQLGNTVGKTLKGKETRCLPNPTLPADYNLFITQFLPASYHPPDPSTPAIRASISPHNVPAPQQTRTGYTISGFKRTPTLAAYPNPSSRSQMAAHPSQTIPAQGLGILFQDGATNRSYGYPFHTEQITDEGAFR